MNSSHVHHRPRLAVVASTCAAIAWSLTSPATRAIEPGEISGQLDDTSATLNDGSYYAPHDLTLEAGERLAIDLISEEFDPFLLLLDPSGNELAQDDDSGDGDDARIVLTVPQTGRYQVWVNSYAAGEVGGYILRWGEASAAMVAHYEALQAFDRGISLYNAGRHPEAIATFETALAALLELDHRDDRGDLETDRSTEANLRSYLGMSYYFTGNLSGAVSMLETSVAIAQAEGNIPQTLTSRLNLASIYNALGRYEDSLALNQETRVQAQAAGEAYTEAAAIGNMALIHRRLGDYDQAIVLHRQAYDLFEAIGEPEQAAYALSNLSLVYQQLDRYVEAVEVGRELLVLFDRVDDQRGLALVWGNLSTAYRRLEDYEAAIAASEQAIAILRDLGDRRELATALHNIGSTYNQIDELDLAESSLYEAVDLLDAMRSPDLSDRDRVSLFETQISSFRLLQVILLRQGKWGQALEVAERSRARAFVFLLDQQLHDSSEQTVSVPVPPTIAEIQAIARDHNATLVEYTQLHDDLIIWVIRPDGQIFGEFVSLKDQTQSLESLVMASRCPNVRCENRVLTSMRSSGSFDPGITRDAFADFNASETGESNALQQQLYNILIAPIADYLPTDPEELVIFIPEGSLFLVAFPALQDEAGAHLIEKHTLSIAPAIEVLSKTRQLAARRAENNSILIVGNPTMPDGLTSLDGAEIEANQIADLWSTVMLTANEATETRIVEQMPQARVIHLATHGIFDDQAGLSSAIALAPSPEDDGWLTAAEILDLSLNADLVGLSACSTGLGRISGDGVIGLSRSLMVSGVPSVLVSLWNVNDRATADLMVEFYKVWQGGEMGKARALRRAMLNVKEKYPNPYYWAAFTLIGEPE
jgi:tetratricopeptide (TPR) repeat protein